MHTNFSVRLIDAESLMASKKKKLNHPDTTIQKLPYVEVQYPYRFQLSSRFVPREITVR